MPRIKPKRLVTPGPQNKRAVTAVQQAVDHYYGRRRDSFLNTLAAGGIMGTIYIPRPTGNPCTCREEINILNPDGVMDETGLQSILEGGAEGNPEPDYKATRKPEKVYQPTTGPIDFTQIHNVIVDVEPPPASQSTFDTGSDYFLKDAIGDDISALNDDEDDEFGDPSFIDTVHYSGYSANACTICYGRGVSGGLDLFRGFRLVLTSEDDPTISDGLVNTTVSPYAFVPDEEDEPFFVDFECIVPMGSQPVGYRLNNNREEVDRDYYNLYYFDGIAWTEIKDLSPLVQGKPVTLRIESAADFTHLEATFLSNPNPVYIDFPQLQSGLAEKDLLSASGEIEMYIGGDVPGLEKHAMVRDSKYGYLWYLVEVTAFRDPKGRVLHYEADARRIQPHEVFHHLL